MSIDIVKCPEQQICGLVLPNVTAGPKDRTDGLLAFTLERMRERGLTEIVTAFLPRPGAAAATVAVVGYRCDGTRQLADGDVLVRIPPGYFAKFTSDGLSLDPVADVWDQAEAAAADGRIDRAFAEEIEITRAPNGVELYISLM